MRISTVELKSGIILCIFATALLPPCARADFIFTCHNPFTTPTDETKTAMTNGDCESVDSSRGSAVASGNVTFSYLSPATPSYLSGAEVSTDVFISGFPPVPLGTYLLARTDFSVSESFRISGYVGAGILEFPFFNEALNQAPHDPNPTCGLTLQAVTKDCSGNPDSATVPFSAGEILTLTLFGTVQTTGLFNSDNFFQDDIFTIYPPVIRNQGGVIQTSAGIALVTVPEPSSLMMAVASAVVCLAAVILKVT